MRRTNPAAVDAGHRRFVRRHAHPEGAERWQVQMSVDAAELTAGLDPPGCAPAQRHAAVLPVLHIAGVAAGDGDHRLVRSMDRLICMPASWHAPVLRRGSRTTPCTPTPAGSTCP